MGTSGPPLSDEPRYTMVESAMGNCGCAYQDDYQMEQSSPSSGVCCSPHIFTSVLLGILACVLMTGGVFLAFHRWDPMWLMVSGVGVILVLIGAVLHCCHNMSLQRDRRISAVGGKNVCPRPLPPDHVGHMSNNNGSLTEQLLPLSNARSVSQLSLNMLPGYFPPVVTTYGIEQHSTVVQNINKIIQQQQSQSSGSCSPGVASTAGKSFIVLSLPGDTSASNIQNLVATVYQLDGSNAESVCNDANSTSAPPIAVVKANTPPAPLILKNAEVQTCNVWPTATSTTTTSTSAERSVVGHSSDATNGQIVNETLAPSTNSGTTQTDDFIPTSENLNLIDCSSSTSPICDNPESNCDNQPEGHSVRENIPSSSSSDLLNASELSEPVSGISGNIPDIPEPESADIPSSDLLVDVDRETSSCSLSRHHDVLVDVNRRDELCCNNACLTDDLECAPVHHVDEVVEQTRDSQLINDNAIVELPDNVPAAINPELETRNAELLSNCSNDSVVDIEIDDSELQRASPPPSYEDVTHEGENIGAFGLSYGTI